MVTANSLSVIIDDGFKLFREAGSREDCIVSLSGHFDITKAHSVPESRGV